MLFLMISGRLLRASRKRAQRHAGKAFGFFYCDPRRSYETIFSFSAKPIFFHCGWVGHPLLWTSNGYGL